MDVATIEMDPKEAQAKLDAYREALKGRHAQEVEEEWRAAEAAYKELAKGTALIDPFQAIRDCGWRPDGRPVLAIARADQRRVRFEVARHMGRWKEGVQCGPFAPMTWRFTTGQQQWRAPKGYGRIFEVDKIEAEPPDGKIHSGTAMVPMVPPDVIPPRGADLSKHFVLWEVESWDLAPPVDPILLRPIGGHLYAVVAQWDLTEVERMIIAGTRRPG